MPTDSQQMRDEKEKIIDDVKRQRNKRQIKGQKHIEANTIKMTQTETDQVAHLIKSQAPQRKQT